MLENNLFPLWKKTDCLTLLNKHKAFPQQNNVLFVIQISVILSNVFRWKMTLRLVCYA